MIIVTFILILLHQKFWYCLLVREYIKLYGQDIYIGSEGFIGEGGHSTWEKEILILAFKHRIGHYIIIYTNRGLHCGIEDHYTNGGKPNG